MQKLLRARARVERVAFHTRDRPHLFLVLRDFFDRLADVVVLR